MITRTHITQISTGKIKVSVIYNESGIRISRFEILYASARPNEIADAVARVKGAVAIHLATLQEMNS